MAFFRFLYLFGDFIILKNEVLKRKLSACSLSIKSDIVVVNTCTLTGNTEVYTESYNNITTVWYQEPNFRNKQYCNVFIRCRDGTVLSVLVENGKFACDTILKKISNRSNVSVNNTPIEDELQYILKNNNDDNFDGSSSRTCADSNVYIPFKVNTSKSESNIERIECPHCGTKQFVSRSFCFKCGYEFNT